MQKKKSFWLQCLSIAINIFFGCYLVLDLVIGSIYYRSEIGMITGWIHHLCYIGFVIALIRHGAENYLTLGFLEEVPTLLLALQQLFKIGFHGIYGCLFVATRIVYHLMILWCISDHQIHHYPIYVCASAFVPHCIWFLSWIRFYVQKTKEARVSP